MSRKPSLRASDADREAVADRLRRAAVEGRLQHEELEERLHAAFRAATYGDLDRLLVDLPRETTVQTRRAPRPLPVARAAVAVALPVAIAVAAVAMVAVVAALAAAWWLVCAVIWLVLRAHGGCGHRRIAGAFVRPRAMRGRPARFI